MPLTVDDITAISRAIAADQRNLRDTLRDALLAKQA